MESWSILLSVLCTMLLVQKCRNVPCDLEKFFSLFWKNSVSTVTSITARHHTQRLEDWKWRRSQAGRLQSVPKSQCCYGQKTLKSIFSPWTFLRPIVIKMVYSTSTLFLHGNIIIYCKPLMKRSKERLYKINNTCFELYCMLNKKERITFFWSIQYRSIHVFYFIQPFLLIIIKGANNSRTYYLRLLDVCGQANCDKDKEVPWETLKIFKDTNMYATGTY